MYWNLPGKGKLDVLDNTLRPLGIMPSAPRQSQGPSRPSLHLSAHSMCAAHSSWPASEGRTPFMEHVQPHTGSSLGVHSQSRSLTQMWAVLLRTLTVKRPPWAHSPTWKDTSVHSTGSHPLTCRGSPLSIVTTVSWFVIKAGKKRRMAVGAKNRQSTLMSN